MDGGSFIVRSVASVLAVPAFLAQVQTATQDRPDRFANLGGAKVRLVVFILVLGVFIVMAAVIALRHRESIFDTIEFEGMKLFKKAVWATVILIAVAFLALMVINNLR